MTKREVFLQLFYRERVGRLSQRLKTQVASPLPGADMTVQEIADYLSEIVARAEDPDRCNELCKDMYFCDREQGHEGLHREEPGLTWE